MSCAMQVRHAGVVQHQLVCGCDGSSLIVMQDMLNDGGGGPVPVPAADDILELDTEPGPKNPSSRIPARRPNPAPAPAPAPVRLLPLLGRPRGVYGCPCTCPKPYPSGALSLRARDSFLSWCGCWCEGSGCCPVTVRCRFGLGPCSPPSPIVVQLLLSGDGVCCGAGC